MLEMQYPQMIMDMLQNVLSYTGYLSPAEEQAKEDEKQRYNEQRGMQKQYMGLQQDQFNLTKMMGEQQLFNQADEKARKRKIQRALARLSGGV